MTRTPTLVAITAAIALAGCDPDGQTIVAGGPADPMADQLANAAPVELPPSIQASHSYRCRDNSLVYINWMSNNTAQLRTERGASPVVLRQAEPAEPGATAEPDAPAVPSGTLTAEGGYALSGAADDSSISLTRPGTGAQTCNA